MRKLTSEQKKIAYNTLLQIANQKRIIIYKNDNVREMINLFYDIMPIYYYDDYDFDYFIRHYKKLNKIIRLKEYKSIMNTIMRYDSYILKKRKNYIIFTPITPKVAYISIELKGRHYEVK